MADSLRMLIDTSTLINADLDRVRVPSSYRRETQRYPDADASAAIQAILFNDEVLLDGPSVERNSETLRWLSNIDEGVVLVSIDPSEASSLYERGAMLASKLNHSEGTRHLLDSMSRSLSSVREVVGPLRSFSVPELSFDEEWSDSVEVEYKKPELEPIWSVLQEKVGKVISRERDGWRRDVRSMVAISRFFYYAALQEQLGCSLMLDSGKSRVLPGYSDEESLGGKIFEIFDEEVVTRYRERRARWLGSLARSGITLPIVTGYALREADLSRCSLGEVLVDLRNSREVKRFRSGLRELVSLVETSDNTGVDKIINELERAAKRWSERLGIPQEVKKLKVTVPLQVIEPEFNIPIGRIRRRSTAEKMLIFVDHALERGLIP